MKEQYIAQEAKMFNHEQWLPITSVQIVRQQIEKYIVESGFNIVGFSEHNFPVKGYTCVWLLAESHLAIHTFPDDSMSYLQISSCNRKKLNRFKELLKELTE